MCLSTITGIMSRRGFHTEGVVIPTLLWKTTQSTPIAKSSVKSWLRARLSEEMLRRRGRHKRSSTYPIRSQFERTDSIHHLELSEQDILSDVALTDGSLKIADENTKSSSSASAPGVVLQKTCQEPFGSEKKYEEHGTMLYQNYMGDKQVDGSGKPLIENLQLFQEGSDETKQDLLKQMPSQATELTNSTSFQQSRDFRDALDIINMNKEFFLKVLQDPSSHLAHNFHSRRASRTGYNKSVSFPLPGSSDRRSSGPGRLKLKQDGGEGHAKDRELQVGSQDPKSEYESTEDMCRQSVPSIATEYRADVVLKFNQSMAEIGDSSSSSHSPKRNRRAIKRFRDLKQKIKHAIRESKYERHRISMDALLHKIPHRHGFSKDLKELADQLKTSSPNTDGKASPGSSCRSDYSVPSTGKSGRRSISRTSSLNESLDRYCQLYESTINREAKHLISGMQLKAEERDSPKSLGRIHSSPELKYLFYQSPEDGEAFSIATPAKVVADDNVSIRSNSDEQMNLDLPVASEYLPQLHTLVESQIEEKSVEVNEIDYIFGDQQGSICLNDSEPYDEVGLVSDDLENVMGEDSSHSKQEIRLTMQDSDSTDNRSSSGIVSIPEDSEDSSHFSNAVDGLPNQQEDKSSIDIKDVGIWRKQEIDSDVFNLQVDAKYKPTFNYVRDILELSGFSGSESLGTWHSDDQPVDPSLFEEVEGCMLLDPDCSGQEEGGYCNHLLLFDLTNEVLMDIYERSYTYCPMQLSSLSHIRPMPVGHHVLKEVWTNISWYLGSRPNFDWSLDYVVSRDLGKDDGWLNLQFDTECVGLELEDFIFDDLLEEIIRA
ncbi:uncharacterized protein LOC119995703 isoform X2 [Tripterygium wilfordii]|uniref:uncharacterized protein LOC119995703 isoform X2 n=1 Tax=Tripterygium wilfordii TaxID=458696 RepID=UPI0018F8489F|nr:uncharacterized protein LOC119995703 isoform X2 [Tripterygium wilfordii]